MADSTRDHSDNFLNTGQFIGGDITEDNDITSASGQGAVATGEGGLTNAATGPFAVSNFGGEVSQAQGAGSQVLSHSSVGQQAFNSDGAVLGQGSQISGVNTGVNTGVVSGGGVDRTVVGDHNAQANLEGAHDTALSFGGNASNVSDNFGVGSNFNAGGSQQSFTGNELHDSTLAGHDGVNAPSHDTNYTEDNTSIFDHTVDTQSVQHGLGVADQHFNPVNVNEHFSAHDIAGDDVFDN